MRGYGVTLRREMVAFSLLVLLLAICPFAALADIEEGGIKQHGLFEFEAFIKHGDIKDGGGPFDADNSPGNDSAEDNGIIRSFDTATYPLKITVNPKEVDKLENIKLRITGHVENGVTGNRINASFAVGGTENVQKESVTFVQEYTIQQTGNSIMIPVALNVMGAENGTVLTPHLQVQVVSIDGKDITSEKVIQTFDSLPTLTVSSRVSLGAVLRNAGGGDVDYLSRYMSNVSSDDDYILNKVGVAFFAKNLPGRTDSKGTSMPTGKINFSIGVTGEVYWDKTRTTVPLDFVNKDTPVRLFDIQSIDWNTGSYIGQPNTIMDGIQHGKGTGYSGVPQSKMSNINDMATVTKEQPYKVWDSGIYRMKPVVAESSRTAKIDGQISDYIIGSSFPIREAPVDNVVSFGPEYKVFSTRNITFAAPTEYRVGGLHNKESETNNVYYNVTVNIESYEDTDGKVTEAKSASNTYRYNQRNGVGSLSTSLKFWSEKAAPLGTVARSNSYAPYGDESILKGQNVQSRYRAANYGANMNGGMVTMIKWNIDSFELTKANASSSSIQYLQAKTKVWRYGPNNTVTQQLGVPKNTDMSFRTYLNYDLDDYTWYDTYDDAVKHGKIGAMKYDIKDDIEVGATIMSGNVPLTVTTNKVIGSLNAKGTPNVSTQITYAYYDKGRTLSSKLLDSRYASYTEYDANGYVTALQRPVGGDISFDTLGIVNANLSNKIVSDKDTYYSSDDLKWNVKSTMVLPDAIGSGGFDSGGLVTLEEILPKGLLYKVNSAKIGGRPIEPEIKQNANGTTSLLFEILLSTNSTAIEDLNYETVINPLEIQDGVRANFTVQSVISSEIDTRAKSFRTSSKSINIIKIGMVGIYESIRETYGDKNSVFQVTLSPYTTIEDEVGVTGLTHIPLAGDKAGSKYTGSAALSGIELLADRQLDEGDVLIYLNNAQVINDKPQLIDVSTSGWRKYTGDASELIGATSILFHVEGKMTNKDKIEIKLTIKTDNNAFGDVYLNETVINSATNYNLSPVSNRVRYTIRPDLELTLERFQIYTDKASNGLPTSVRVRQVVLAPERVKDKPITLAIINSETGAKVVEKTLKQHELQRENLVIIPPETLTKGTVTNYEVRIQDFDGNTIWVKDGEGELETEGHTAKESTLTNADKLPNGDVFFTGVAMTERESGKEIVRYSESVTVKPIVQPKVKSGYGFAFDVSLIYTNAVLSDSISRTGANSRVDGRLDMDSALMDESLEYHDAESGKGIVPMVSEDDLSIGNTVVSSYQPPQVFLEPSSGNMYTPYQKDASEMTGVPVDAGHKLYVPVWIDGTGTYDLAFQTTVPLGVHYTSVDLMNSVNVYAFMFSHTDSDSPDDDELLVTPMTKPDNE